MVILAKTTHSDHRPKAMLSTLQAATVLVMQIYNSIHMTVSHGSEPAGTSWDCQWLPVASVMWPKHVLAKQGAHLQESCSILNASVLQPGNKVVSGLEQPLDGPARSWNMPGH